ncbi:MAG: ribonuclease T2 [Candidatus Binatia bacterium]
MRCLAVLGVLVAASLVGLPSEVVAGRASSSTEPGDFDAYVLALSWSPQHCRTHPKERGSHECGTANGFIVHGLWPQADYGANPTACRHSGGPSNEVVTGMLDLMPSAGLIRHEWQAHGSCSGQSPTHYFRDVRSAYERFTIPPAYRTIRDTTVTTLGEIERAFIEANPTLKPNRLSVVCDGKALREIRICLDKELQPRACRDGGRDRCPGRGITVFPRGSSPD